MGSSASKQLATRPALAAPASAVQQVEAVLLPGASEPPNNLPVNPREGNVAGNNVDSRALQPPTLSRAASLPRALMALAHAPGQERPDAPEAAAAAATLKNLQEQQALASDHDSVADEGEAGSGIAVTEQIDPESEHGQPMKQKQQQQQQHIKPLEASMALSQKGDPAATATDRAVSELNDGRDHDVAPRRVAATAHVVAGMDGWSPVNRRGTNKRTDGGGNGEGRATLSVKEGLTEAQYGGRGRGGRDTLLAGDGTVIYASLSSVVVLRSSTCDDPRGHAAAKKSFIYDKHRFEVVCLALHHRQDHQLQSEPSQPQPQADEEEEDRDGAGGNIVASSDAGRASRVLVWRADTLETLASLPSCHAKGASILCFGGLNGSMLATVGAEPSNGPGQSIL